jgi:hypothetical protein
MDWLVLPPLASQATALARGCHVSIISSRKLRWAGHVDAWTGRLPGGWSPLPRKLVPHESRRGSTHRVAAEDGHTPTGTPALTRELQLISDRLQHRRRQGGRAARRLAELGGRSPRQRLKEKSKWRKLAARLTTKSTGGTAGACGTPTHLGSPNKRGRNVTQ